MSDRFDNIRIKPESKEETKHKADNDESTTIAESDKLSSLTSAIPEKQPESTQKPARIVQRRKKRREFKHTKLLLWGMAPFFLALLYIVGSYLLIPVIVKGPLTKQLATSLNRSVTLNRVIFSPLTLQLYVHDVSISGPYGDTSSRYLLDCRKLEGRIGLTQLFNRKLIIHQVKINGLSLNFERGEQGLFDIEQILHLFQPGRGGTGEFLWPDWLVLDGIDVTDSQILFDDRITGKQHRIEEIAFYLPSTGNMPGSQQLLPRLDAVFNSSPVQVNGHRSRNETGAMETRFNFSLSKVVLGNYLKYIPISTKDRLKLTEGQADLNLILIIPATDASQNMVIRGTADVDSVRIINSQNITVFRSPGAYLDFSVAPVAGQIHFNKIVLFSPELNISTIKESAGNKPQFTFGSLKHVYAAVQNSAREITCDLFQWEDGNVTMSSAPDGRAEIILNNVAGTVNGFSNRSKIKGNETDTLTAAFFLRGQGDSAKTPMNFSIEGNLFSNAGMKGKVDVTNLDLKKYSLFSNGSMGFKQGRAKFESTFEYAGSNEKTPFFKFNDGNFNVSDYVISSKKKNILSGDQLSCQNFQADSGKKKIFCNRFETVKAEIYGDRLNMPGMLPGEDISTWRVQVAALHVENSTLFATLKNPLTGKKDINLKLDGFSLDANDLEKSEQRQDNIQLSAKINQGGTLTAAGTYSLTSKNGRLKVEVKDVGSNMLKPVISPWFIPVVRGGRATLLGTYLVDKQQFSGSFTLDDFEAGHRKESYVRMKQFSSDSVQIGLKPFVFTTDEILVREPVIVPGLSDAGKTINLFVRRLKNSLAENSIQIGTVRLQNGRYRLAEPILFSGYQPELNSIKGTVTSIGSLTKPVSYSLEGVLDDQSMVRVTGTAEKGNLTSYSLNVINFPLDRFSGVFLDGGLDTSEGRGEWHQIMLKEKDQQSISSRITLNDVQPAMQSRYAKIAALYIDNERAVRLDTTGTVTDDDASPFLFQSIVRYLQRNAVKAELSYQLILERLVPELKLEEKVHFAPGSTILVNPPSIHSFKELVQLRPYLLLELKGGVDPAVDKAALHDILLQNKSIQRDSENNRRRLERERILEEQRAKLVEMKGKSDQVVEEPIPSWELLDLHPLPPVAVSVSENMLTELAMNRARALQEYFVSQLEIPGDRVAIAENTDTNGAFVQVYIQPFMNPQTTPDKVNQNDTETDRTNENSPAI